LFGTFLFLTYYLQVIKGYAPVKTGFAFLPMTIVLMVTSIAGSTVLRPRVGPRVLVAIGMALGTSAMLYLTRLGVGSSYAAGILPPLLALGIGLALVFSIAINSATLGVRPSDIGVASATANASQQVGGSLGAALLSTVAASATTSYLKGLPPSPAVVARASVHGYTTAFAWSAAIFAVGAVVAALLYTGGRQATVAVPATESTDASALAD
jgi:hypothetical protein